MECKRVYDPIGSVVIDGNGNAMVEVSILLPLVVRDGRNTKLTVNMSKPFNISSNGFNAFLIGIDCEGEDTSLRNEEPADIFPVKFTIKSDNLNWTKGKSIRLIIQHSRDLVYGEPEPGLIECAKEYVNHAGYLKGWEFDTYRCTDCWVSMSGPKRKGESVLSDM